MLQDIRPYKKSLREVLPKKNAPAGEVKSLYSVSDSRTGASADKRERRRRRTFFVAAFLLISAAAVFASVKFGQVIIQVEPHRTEIMFAETLEASISPVLESSLSHEVISTNRRTASKETETTGSERVSERATGLIVVYNNYGREGQNLVAGTRFRSPGGKIFRIREPVVVPGLKLVEGQTIPGSVEVVVYAEEPGDAYDLGLTDFVIPGFEGSLRFDKFYARSKTPLAGGFVGERQTVAAETRERIRGELQEQLRQELLAEARFQLPEEFVLYEGAAVFDFRDETDWTVPAGSRKIILQESGQLQGVVFRRQPLINQLVKRQAPEFESYPAKIDDLERLAFTFLDVPRGSLDDEKHIRFELRGGAVIASVIPVTELQRRLAGAARSEIEDLLKSFPQIKTVKISARPGWLNYLPRLPKDPRRIVVRES